MHIEVTWPTFKDFIDTRNVSPQFVLESSIYQLRAADNFFSLGCKLKTGADDASITDFNANYLNIANSLPPDNTIRHLGQSDITLSTRTLRFTSAGNKDKLLTSVTGLTALRGGVLWMDKADWEFGDRIGVQIIDKDDVLGLGGGLFIVSEYIPNGQWSVIPDQLNNLIDESITSPIPDGLYFRLKVVAGGLSTPKGIVNIYSYEV